MTRTLVQDVRPWGGPAADLVLSDGVIAAVVPAGTAEPARSDVLVAGGGRLALPAFTDAHVHLDSTRIGLPYRPHSVEPPSGLWDLIENDRRHWRDAGPGRYPDRGVPAGRDPARAGRPGPADAALRNGPTSSAGSTRAVSTATPSGTSTLDTVHAG